jgi:hypothetical protein
MQYSLSAHAQKRSRQRGIRSTVVDFVLQHADVELEAGNGCRSLRISKRGLATLIRNGASGTDVERATNVIVVVCEENNEVVTVMHDCNSLGRRYRRQFPVWNRPLKQQSRAA